MDSIFDTYPQRFYLLSAYKRKLMEYHSPDNSLEQAVEDAFNKIKRIEGGNIHAVYKYEYKTLLIMQELSDKYKAQYPCVQQLPAFFRGLKEGELFVRQKTSGSLFDFKSSVISTYAIAYGLDINKTHQVFCVNWAKLYLTFETHSFGFLPYKVYIGEEDKTKRRCRFCHKSGVDRFQNTSHAIQESLGNHLLIANEECDECNSLFSNSVETQLFRFLETNRTLSKVKGKGKSSYHQEGLNFHIHPDSITWMPIIYVKKEFIINEVYQNKPTGKILLYNKGAVTYKGIYKALVKIAVDMIPENQIHHFSQTGEWVHGDFEANSLPPFSYGEHAFFFEQPVLDLFFRNERSPKNAPFCTAVLYIYDSVFIYIVPFNDVDSKKSITANDILSHLQYFKNHEYLYVQEWVDYDSNDTKEYAVHYKINPLGVEGKYDVEYRPANDSVFEVKK